MSIGNNRIIGLSDTENGRLSQLKFLRVVLSFIIPFVLIILVYIAVHVAPFGDHTLIISDARALYISDLSFISRALRGQEDLLYSFQQGIGMNLMGSHSGLLNPANIIVLFFDITNYATMYSLLMAINMSLCGLTMYLFLSHLYERKTYHLVFSTCYALIGFNVANCFQFNFILSVELLPLIAWGIVKILRGQRPWLYIISLGYGILSSFYFGYMLCIASVALFLMWYFKDANTYKPMWKTIFRNYCLSSVISGLLPAFMWMPALSSFAGGRLEQNSILDFSFAENMSIFDALAKLFIGANNINQLVSGFPNIFCGTLTVFLCIAFFADRRNIRREKLCYAAILVFYFITFYISAFSMSMQGFSATNWFNFRYSFVFSFLLLIIASREFGIVTGMSREDLRRSVIVFILFVVAIFSQRYSFVSGGGMLLSVFLLAIILGGILWNQKDPHRAPRSLVVILTLIVCSAELYVNYIISYNNIKEWELTETELKNETFAGSIIADGISKSDPTFYRIGNEHSINERCANDPRLYGYNGLIYFGSCESQFVFQGLSKLGASWWANRMWYKEGEPAAFDSLLGAKYVVARRDLTEEKGYEKLLVFGEDVIHRNPNALPIAVLAQDAVDQAILGTNPFANHNALWKALTGSDKNVFTQEDDITFTFHNGINGRSVSYQEALETSAEVSTFLTDSESVSAGSSGTETTSSGSGNDNDLSRQANYIEYTFTAKQDGAIYAYNGLGIDAERGYASEAMKYVGIYKKGDTVTDSILLPSEYTTMEGFSVFCAEYYVAYANADVLAHYTEGLQNTAGELIKITDSYLIGSVDAASDGRLFFTIPYDEGWTLRIDGTETVLMKTADLFMSAPISSGSHTYELSFFPKNMKAGIIVSGVAVFLLIGLAAFTVSDNRKRKADAGETPLKLNGDAGLKDREPAGVEGEEFT